MEDIDESDQDIAQSIITGTRKWGEVRKLLQARGWGDEALIHLHDELARLHGERSTGQLLEQYDRHVRHYLARGLNPGDFEMSAKHAYPIWRKAR